MSPVRARLVLAATTTLLAAAAAFCTHRACGGPRSTTVVTSPSGGADEQTWQEQEPFVVDPVAGLRVRRGAVTRHPMTALDLSDPRAEIVKRRDTHAFLRGTELPDPLDRPAVLVVGDSHVDGVVDTADNFTSLLENASAATPRPFYCLNAGCGLYSLWQDVLRARDLLPRWRPQVVVVTVFLGNDFVDLDNPRMPHLDDELHECAAATTNDAETTTARMQQLALQEPFSQLFFQGLNQALRAHRDPTRVTSWMQKSAHAIDAMERAAAGSGARVLWALLPSFDLVFPDRARPLSPLAGEVVTGGVQRRVRDAFVELLTARKANVVDLEPAFRADGELALYALDFHIYRRGHRRAFEALERPVNDLLAR